MSDQTSSPQPVPTPAGAATTEPLALDGPLGQSAEAPGAVTTTYDTPGYDSPTYDSPTYDTPGYTAAGTGSTTVDDSADVDTDRSHRGPAPFTVLVGLVCVAVAILAFVSQVTDVDVDWGSVGPLTVVGVGVVLVLLGLLGMRTRRR